MTRARDLSKLLGTANNGVIPNSNLGVSFENISDSGTTGTKIASGTTGQRGSTAGQIRFNTTTGLAEYYDGSIFKSIDVPPTVTAVSPLEVDSQAGGNVTFTITGTNFQSGAVAKFIGNDTTEITAATTTVTNSTTISAVIAKSSFVSAKEPYDVKIINGSSLSATLDNQINVDTSPTWSTASGQVGGVIKEGDAVSFSVSATDADSDTIVYSVNSGTLPTGLSLNSSTGAITGTAPAVSGDTTSSFTLRATANSKTADRAFNIIVLNQPIPQSNLVYDFRASDFSGSAGTLSDGTSLSSCLSTRGVNSSSQFSSEVEFGNVTYTTSDTYAPNGKAFILSGSGLLEINPANTTVANSYFNLIPSVSWVIWIDWNGSDRQGFFSRFHDGDGIYHFNHMMDSTTQFHYNQGGVNLAAANLANGTWQVTSGNQWQLIHITYNHTTGIQTWYIDGTSYATVNMGTNSGSGMSGYNNFLTPHALGGRTDNIQMMSGRIAEARYYNRVLTNSEVSNEWNETKASFGRT